MHSNEKIDLLIDFLMRIVFLLHSNALRFIFCKQNIISLILGQILIWTFWGEPTQYVISYFVMENLEISRNFILFYFFLQIWRSHEISKILNIIEVYIVNINTLQ